MTRAELTWYFSTIRWIPLFLLTAIGITDLLMQPAPSKSEHWLFFLTAIVLGVLLFRLGCLLMTCNQTKRYARVSGR
jgi:branched-subunit amino acid transport protein